MSSNDHRTFEARRMLNAFGVAAGVQAFDITFINLSGQKGHFQERTDVKKVIPIFEKTLETENVMQHNFFIRPAVTTKINYLIQCDGLSKKVLYALKSLAFIGLKVAKGSFQAWFSIEGEIDEEYHIKLRKALRAIDHPLVAPPTRLAGSRNFQENYAPDFPIIEVVYSDKHTTTTKKQLDEFVASCDRDEKTTSGKKGINIDVSPALPSPKEEKKETWPVYKPDLSDPDRADFFWCMAVASKGKTAETIASKLSSLSKNAQKKGKLYALTVARTTLEFQKKS